MGGICKQCSSGKQTQTQYKCSDGHRHCSKTCMDRHGRVKSDETKAQKKLANDKNNTKISLNLEERKKAKNIKLRAQGVGIDAN